LPLDLKGVGDASNVRDSERHGPGGDAARRELYLPFGQLGAHGRRVARGAVRGGPGERNGGEQQPRGVPDRNGMHVRHTRLSSCESGTAVSFDPRDPWRSASIPPGIIPPPAESLAEGLREISRSAGWSRAPADVNPGESTPTYVVPRQTCEDAGWANT